MICRFLAACAPVVANTAMFTTLSPDLPASREQVDVAGATAQWPPYLLSAQAEGSDLPP
jgi:hypothetical protein